MNVIRCINRQSAIKLTRPIFLCQRSIVSSSYKSNNKQKEDSNNFSRWIRSMILSCGIGVVSYNLYKTMMSRYMSSSLPFSDLVPKISAATKMPSRRAQFNFIADVVQETSNALVYIEIQDGRRMDFFTGKPVSVSNGSGFVVESNSKTSLILTNAHVVVQKPHSIVSVRLTDGRTFMGVVEAIDPVSDLATVRIPCKNLSPMKLGQSSTLRSGEWVVALGSPLTLSNTVTAGVVSSTQRHSEDLGLRGRDINYIQTDAAITFGNSGGPLVNLDGEVIGINSMKVTAGISFAIPIDYATNFLKMADERVKAGRVSTPAPGRRYMGITMLTLTPDILRELKQRGSEIPDAIQNGILVWKVIVGSPSHTGGLMAGDIILNINGKDVVKSADIYEILTGNIKVLKMIVLRGSKFIEVSVTPEDPE